MPSPTTWNASSGTRPATSATSMISFPCSIPKMLLSCRFKTHGIRATYGLRECLRPSGATTTARGGAWKSASSPCEIGRVPPGAYSAPCARPPKTPAIFPCGGPSRPAFPPAPDSTHWKPGRPLFEKNLLTGLNLQALILIDFRNLDEMEAHHGTRLENAPSFSTRPPSCATPPAKTTCPSITAPELSLLFADQYETLREC